MQTNVKSHHLCILYTRIQIDEQLSFDIMKEIKITDDKTICSLVLHEW